MNFPVCDVVFGPNHVVQVTVNLQFTFSHNGLVHDLALYKICILKLVSANFSGLKSGLFNYKL